MPTINETRALLIEKLQELFQLDQPDLDFGFYRIMHLRSREISEFLENDLLGQVQEALTEYTPIEKQQVQKQLAEAIKQAENLGADPESLPKVKELREKLTESIDLQQVECDVYDALYHFFSRYYSDGDFISQRVYKEGVYAIPYEGEEVKLHWANADQYYVKTCDYLRDYCFRTPSKRRVHFKLIDAAEEEHGNIKAAEGKKRVFILAKENFCSEENGELVLRFEYRPATMNDWRNDQRNEETSPPSQEALLALAEAKILAFSDIENWTAELNVPYKKSDGEEAEYSILYHHLKRYAARNSFDYFIHKDLGTFLRRELDFFIKNEIMFLDDIEKETAPRVEQYLSKLRAIRRIAKKIIDFLAQLENYQKKLWLKKKFVVETNYCITLDRVPEELYPEIIANDAQREEWVKLFAIDEMTPVSKQGTTTIYLNPGFVYSSPLTIYFLNANQNLVLDTKFFSDDFKQRLIASIDNFDEQCDGLLIHSENFQALKLLQNRFREQVKCIYIDPPYNTGGDGFIYRDNYQHSSWMTMIQDRIDISSPLLNESGRFFSSIDDNEHENLVKILKNYFGDDHFLGTITWEKRTKSQNTNTSRQMLQSKTEYILPFAFNDKRQEFNLEENGQKKYPLEDENGIYRLQQIEEMSAESVRGRDTMIFPILEIMPRNGKQWQLGQERINQLLAENRIIKQDGKLYIVIRPTDEGQEKYRPFWSHFFDKEVYGTSESGLAQVDKQLGFGKSFDTVKPIELISKLFFHVVDNTTTILDYFAGSGTTGHAVINLNREDGGSRKYILVEMGDHFDTVLKPRIEKVVYSKEWKGGKPVQNKPFDITNLPVKITLNEIPIEPQSLFSNDIKEKFQKGEITSFRTTAQKPVITPNPGFQSGNPYSGVSHCFKYIRLESYEDTLNNLAFKTNDKLQQELKFNEDSDLREEYMLKYFLEMESQGSPSLLNVEAFFDPAEYQLKIKKPGGDESVYQKIDLLETFNYLIGLKVKNIAKPERFSAKFKRDQDGKLILDGKLIQEKSGLWRFRTVTGETLDGQKVMIIWRNRPGKDSVKEDSFEMSPKNPTETGMEQDNIVLDAWFEMLELDSESNEYDMIYVNGTNNLENLNSSNARWKVRLIEEDFYTKMWE